MLRNHGLLTVGRTVADAFLAMYLFETACTIQVRAQAGGGEWLGIDAAIVATARQQAAQATRGLGASAGLARVAAAVGPAAARLRQLTSGFRPPRCVRVSTAAKHPRPPCAWCPCLDRRAGRHRQRGGWLPGQAVASVRGLGRSLAVELQCAPDLPGLAERDPGRGRPAVRCARNGRRQAPRRLRRRTRSAGSAT
jgi:hypothetical protein